MPVGFDVFFEQPFFSFFREFLRSVHQHFLVSTKSFRVKPRLPGMRARIHPDRIARTRLDTEAAINAAQGIDLVPDRIFLNGVIWIFARFDIDTLRGACSRTQKTGGALNRAVLFQCKPVTAAKGSG